MDETNDNQIHLPELKLITEFQHYFFNNPEIWFNPQCKYDNEVKRRFGSILTELDTNIIKLFIDNLEADNITLYEVIGLIISLDQLPYYVYREKIEVIRNFQLIAVEIVKYIINKGLLYSEELKPEEQCFCLLPLRHSQKPENVKLALKLIKSLREPFKGNITAEPGIYKRFYKATINQMGNINNKLILADIMCCQYRIFPEILDTQCLFNEIFDFPNYLDLSIKHYPHTIELIKLTKEFYLKNGINRICVSLSGGVDSIVLLYTLSKIKEINVSAIHINYGNRATADKEAEMCSAICQHLNISLYRRDITEIKRERGYDRENYEETTRNIRFGMYYKLQNREGYTIALGHNKDDCLENIVSNIIKQKKYDNLSGMTALSKESNVEITRPFLEIPKSQIYLVANECRLPYLYDSTPEWSERGRKRDILFPAINDFDTRILPGLYTMAQHYQSVMSVYSKAVKDNIIILEEGNKYQLLTINDLTHLQASLSELCSIIGEGYFSQRAVNNLWELIKAGRHIGKYISLSSNWYFMIKEVKGADGYPEMQYLVLRKMWLD